MSIRAAKRRGLIKAAHLMGGVRIVVDAAVENGQMDYRDGVNDTVTNVVGFSLLTLEPKGWIRYERRN